MYGGVSPTRHGPTPSTRAARNGKAGAGTRRRASPRSISMKTRPRHAGISAPSSPGGRMSRKTSATTRDRSWWAAPFRAVRPHATCIPGPACALPGCPTAIPSRRTAGWCRTLAANRSARGPRRRVCVACAPVRHNPPTVRAVNWRGSLTPPAASPSGCGHWRLRRGSGVDVRSEGVPGTHATRQRFGQDQSAKVCRDRLDARRATRSSADASQPGCRDDGVRAARLPLQLRIPVQGDRRFRSNPSSGPSAERGGPQRGGTPRYRRGAGRRLALLRFSGVEASCARAMAKVEAPRDVGGDPCRSAPGVDSGMTA